MPLAEHPPANAMVVNKLLDAGWRARFGAMMQAHLAGGGLILAAVHDPLPIEAKVLEIGA